MKFLQREAWSLLISKALSYKGFTYNEICLSSKRQKNNEKYNWPICKV